MSFYFFQSDSFCEDDFREREELLNRREAKKTADQNAQTTTIKKLHVSSTNLQKVSSSSIYLDNLEVHGSVKSGNTNNSKQTKSIYLTLYIAVTQFTICKLRYCYVKS